jgi:PAS domain S-box-containing protein
MASPSVPLDAIRQPAVLYDSGGRIVAANDLAEVLAGRPLAGLAADELAGIFDVHSPDGAFFADAGQTLAQALAGEEVAELPFSVTLADGRRHEILATAAPVREGDGVAGALVVWQDVTARVNAEEAVRALFSASPDIVLLLDADGIVLALNETTAGAFGRPAAEIVGTSVWKTMHPDVVDFRHERFTDALRSGRAQRFEDSQEGRWYDSIVEPILSVSGEVTRVAVVARDITDRKRTEEALRESEKRLRLILDRSLDALYRRDLSSVRNEYYTPAIEAMTGFSVEECLAMSVDEIGALIHPDDRPSVVSEKLGTAPGREEGTVHYRFLCRDGTYRWFSDRFRIERDGEGRPVSWEGVIRDINARMEAERALGESEAKYRALIETNADFVWEMDAQGRYTYCSPQMERLWGIRPEEMIGRTPFDRMPPAARERALAAFTGMARDPGGFSGLEVTSLDGWGNLVSLEIGGVPFFGADGSLLGYRGVTRDVTLRKRAEEGLRESEERLRLAQEAAGIAIWDRNAATDRVTVAPGFIQRYLLEPEAMATYEDWIRYVHPDDREWLESARRAAFAAGGPLDLEFRIVIPSGEVRWIQLKARGVTERGGALGRVLGVIIDVTDRKRAEEALAESEADARSFFENMVDACAICEMVVDERGEPADIRLVDVNPAFERTLGLPARLIVGQTAFMILPTLHREWLDLFVEVGREGGFVEVEEPFPALDRRFHVTGFPVRDGRVAVVFRDVTGI